MANEALRKCPTCDTPLDETVDLGLRDYQWISPLLHGRLSPTDLDFVLERKGRVLIQEYKPRGVVVPMGQRLTLKTFVRMGCDVWIVWEDEKEGTYEVGALDKDGTVNWVERHVPKSRLQRRVIEWLDRADDSD